MNRLLWLYLPKMPDRHCFLPLTQKKLRYYIIFLDNNKTFDYLGFVDISRPTANQGFAVTEWKYLLIAWERLDIILKRRGIEWDRL